MLFFVNQFVRRGQNQLKESNHYFRSLLAQTDLINFVSFLNKALHKVSVAQSSNQVCSTLLVFLHSLSNWLIITEIFVGAMILSRRNCVLFLRKLMSFFDSLSNSVRDPWLSIWKTLAIIFRSKFLDTSHNCYCNEQRFLCAIH